MTDTTTTRHVSAESGGARVVHRELVAQPKSPKAELREKQNAKTPVEASVKATLELNKAAQYVHAVGECSDLRQREQLASALYDLADQVDAALNKFASTATIATDHPVDSTGIELADVDISAGPFERLDAIEAVMKDDLHQEGLTR